MSFQGFATAAEAVAAVRAKSGKVAALAAYLGDLGQDELQIAVRYFAGRIFAVGDSRTLGLGGAALQDVLTHLAPGADLGSLWRRSGDAGEVAMRALAPVLPPASGLSLTEVQARFAAISAARGGEAKAGLLQALVQRCTALECKYVFKLVTAELRIGLREGLVEEAVGIAYDIERTALRRATMVLADLGEVARLAASGRLKDEPAPQWFVPLRYMLATPVPDADAAVRRLGEEIWIEDKYDGIRCQLHLHRGEVHLYSRDLNDVSASFPEVASTAAQLPGDLLLDGELLAFAGGRTLGFAALQKRLGRKLPSTRLLADVPVVYVAWDVLMDGEDVLLHRPLRLRRERLESRLAGSDLRLAHHEIVSGAAGVDRLFLDARARGNEGLMLKEPDSAYNPGRRGLAWLKLKRPLDTLDVVVLGAQWGHGKRHGVLSDVTFGVRDETSGDLVPIGKAYSGLTDAEIAEMTGLLLDATVAEYGSYRQVVPAIVLEVAFDAVQKSGRHRSGYALRFPRISRWRRDKAVSDINTLADVTRLAQLTAIPLQKVDAPQD